MIDLRLQKFYLSFFEGRGVGSEVVQKHVYTKSVRWGNNLLKCLEFLQDPFGNWQ